MRNKPKSCSLCGLVTDKLKKCIYCRKYFCDSHKEAKKHNCPFLGKPQIPKKYRIIWTLFFFLIIIFIIKTVITSDLLRTLGKDRSLLLGTTIVLIGLFFIISNMLRTLKEIKNSKSRKK